jgi:hypothetical protein
MKLIYSYYKSIPTTNQAEEFACANYWKYSWEKNGWGTCMLNSTHSQVSSLCGKLLRKITTESSNIKSDSSKGYDFFNARYVRWCALHAAGGGWMCDYDVVNKAFTTEIADQLEQESTLHINSGDTAYIFYATRDHCESVIRKFIQNDMVENGMLKQEAEILGVVSNLYPILPLVQRTKKTQDNPKSEIMKKLCYE